MEEQQLKRAGTISAPAGGPPPYIQRLLNRGSSSKDRSSSELVGARRETFLQERRDRLATRRFKHSQVLARGRVDLSEKLESLRESLSAAQAARSTIYANIAAAGNREIMRAQEVVQKNKEKLRHETEYRKTKLESKLAAAEKRRELILEYRGRRVGRKIRDGNGNGRSSTDVSSKIPSHVEAAMKIQRFWRFNLCKIRAKRFLSLHLQHETVAGIPFDVITDVLKSANTIVRASNILQSLDLDFDTDHTNFQKLCRTFLSTYMILGHPRTILVGDGPLEDQLIQSTNIFAKQFSEWLVNSSRGQLQCQSQVQAAWQSFLKAFQSWKEDDSAALVQFMVAQYCELDLIYQIVKADSDAIVAAEYHEAIKENQLMLLARIRRIMGDRTRGLLRQAVTAARRKRMPKKTTASRSAEISTQGITPDTMKVQSDKVEFFAFGRRQTRLSNRQLIHELMIDPGYTIKRPVLSAADELAETETKSKFFQLLERELRSNHLGSWIPTIVRESKMRLLRLVMPNSPTFKSISTTFDMTVVEAQCQEGTFDLLHFTQVVVRMMQALCSPHRDSLVAEILCISAADQITLFVMRVDSIFSVLDTLLLDTANFHLRVSSSRLVEEAVDYEKSRFKEELDTGMIDLKQTTRWLQENAAEMRCQTAAYADSQGEGEGETKPEPRDVYYFALAALFVDARELPETLRLDEQRISDTQESFNVIVKTTSYLMAARNLMRAHQASLNPLTWSSLRDRLYTLLTDSDAIDLVSIALEVNKHLDLAYIGLEPKREERHLTLNNMLTSPTSLNPIQKLLRRRLRDLLRCSMSGDISTQQRIISGGFEDFHVRVHKLLESAQTMAKVNWQCYESWYTGMKL